MSFVLTTLVELIGRCSKILHTFSFSILELLSCTITQKAPSRDLHNSFVLVLFTYTVFLLNWLSKIEPSYEYSEIFIEAKLRQHIVNSSNMWDIYSNQGSILLRNPYYISYCYNLNAVLWWDRTNSIVLF